MGFFVLRTEKWAELFERNWNFLNLNVYWNAFISVNISLMSRRGNPFRLLSLTLLISSQILTEKTIGM